MTKVTAATSFAAPCVWLSVACACVLAHAACAHGDARAAPIQAPIPRLWPSLLRAELKQNRNGSIANTTLCYDFAGGRNLNIIVGVHPPSPPLYDNERENGTTYYYHPSGGGGDCKVIDMGVGILRPDWLSGAKFVSTETVNGVVSHCFTQGEAPRGLGRPFVTYCASESDGWPTRWTFFDGAIFDVASFQPGGTCAEAEYAIPGECFKSNSNPNPNSNPNLIAHAQPSDFGLRGLQLSQGHSP